MTVHGGTLNFGWGERPKSLKTTTNPRSTTVGYRLKGVATAAAAKAAAMLYAPRVRVDIDSTTLWRTNIDCTEAGFLLWDIDVTYGPYQGKEPEAGDFKWNFNTTGATKHVSHALSHADSTCPAGEGVADHQGAIGVTEAGEVEGVDVIDKNFKWTESRTLLLGDFAWTYSLILADLTGKVNASSFRGLAAKHVLFEGAEGNFSGKDPLLLEVTYHFSYQPSRLNAVVGACAPINKVGWQYLWVEYRDTEDAAAQRLAKRAVQVNTENVYEETDFSLIGIGTTGLVVPT